MARGTALLERLIEDDYVQEQMTAGADRLLAAPPRGRAVRAAGGGPGKKPLRPRPPPARPVLQAGAEAAQDKKLFDHVRLAAGSFIEAARRLTGKPEPEPPRRLRRLPVVLIGVGVFALVRSMHRAQQGAAPQPG